MASRHVEDLDVDSALNAVTANVGSALDYGTLLTVQGDDAQPRTLGFLNESGDIHFGVGVSGSVTGSGNAGDDLVIRAYEDDGTLIDTPVTITRASGGALAITRPVTMSSTLNAGAGTLTGLTVGSNTASARNITFNVAAGNASYIFFTEVGSTKCRIEKTTSNGLNFHTGSNTLALGINSSQVATFAGNVVCGGTFLRLPVKTTTGHPSSPTEGDVYLNTFDNGVFIYENSAWRTIASW